MDDGGKEQRDVLTLKPIVSSPGLPLCHSPTFSLLAGFTLSPSPFSTHYSLSGTNRVLFLLLSVF